MLDIIEDAFEDITELKDMESQQVSDCLKEIKKIRFIGANFRKIKSKKVEKLSPEIFTVIK